MSENAITFSELRKIQKEERRSDDLKELDDNFFIKVGDYLNRKKEVEDGSREYKNAKRVFRKILSLREDKIVKNARLSLKSNIQASELNMLPREQELFRRMKQEFNRHRDEIQEVTDEHRGKTPAHEREEVEESMQTEESEDNQINEKEEEETEEEETDESFDPEEGYEVVEITSEVPEFMGTDLEAYGPFEEGEQAEIPEDNAEILVNRGNAEQLS
jgi:DNA replication initiation complex subunit (GINS family)